MATVTELTQYRSPHAPECFSGMAQYPGFVLNFNRTAFDRKLRVEYLVIANDMLKDLMTLDPKVSYKALHATDNIIEALYTYLSYDSFNHGIANGCGQKRLITSLRILQGGGPDLIHTSYWASSKRRLLSYSAYKAEVRASPDPEDRAFHLEQSINGMLSYARIRSELCTDSRWLYNTATTLHEAKY